MLETVTRPGGSRSPSRIRYSDSRRRVIQMIRKTLLLLFVAVLAVAVAAPRSWPRTAPATLWHEAIYADGSKMGRQRAYDICRHAQRHTSMGRSTGYSVIHRHRTTAGSRGRTRQPRCTTVGRWFGVHGRDLETSRRALSDLLCAVWSAHMRRQGCHRRRHESYFECPLRAGEEWRAAVRLKAEPTVGTTVPGLSATCCCP